QPSQPRRRVSSAGSPILRGRDGDPRSFFRRTTVITEADAPGARGGYGQHRDGRERAARSYPRDLPSQGGRGAGGGPRRRSCRGGGRLEARGGRGAHRGGGGHGDRGPAAA